MRPRRRKHYTVLVRRVLEENPSGLTVRAIVCKILDMPVKANASKSARRLYPPSRAQVASILRTKIKVVVVDEIRHTKVYALPKSYYLAKENSGDADVEA